MSDSKVSTTTNNLILNPSINKQAETSLREKLNGFTASNTQFLKNDLDFARDYMVQYLLFFDRLIYNAASSPITQNEMNDYSAGKICTMSEFFAPYIEASIYFTYNNTKLIEGGNKTKKQLGGVALPSAAVALGAIALFMLNSGIGYFTGESPVSTVYRTQIVEPIYEVTHQKKVAQQAFSTAVTDFNLQLEDTYFKPNENGYNQFKDWSKSFVYLENYNTDDLITTYSKTLDSFNKVVETGAESFQITFDTTLPKKTTDKLTVHEKTNLFEQIISPVLEKHPTLANAMKKKLFLTKDGSCNNFPPPKNTHSPICLGSGFPKSFEELQAQILLITQAELAPSFGARIMGLFSPSPKSDDYTCPVNIMIPKTVTLNNKQVNFVDTIENYAGLVVHDSADKIGEINEDLCKYRNPDTPEGERDVIKARIVGKWNKFKKPVMLALHPDKHATKSKEVQAEFNKRFTDVGNMFEEVRLNTDVLNDTKGGKRTTRKRGKRNSKRAPRKTKSSRKKRRGRK